MQSGARCWGYNPRVGNKKDELQVVNPPVDSCCSAHCYNPSFVVQPQIIHFSSCRMPKPISFSHANRRGQINWFYFQVKEETRPQMVFTVRHATVTFQTDGDTWREQKEKKAALMVGILIGVFVLCWIPFFITELIVPLCSCDIPAIWKSIFLWLGYSNSFFNPLIYTAFNKNYNNALRNLFSRQR